MDDREATIRHHFDRLMAGDFDGAMDGLADDFVQDWPQSGERLHGRLACSLVYRNYPGGPPTGAVSRIVGGGDTWVVELTLDYGGKPSHGISIFEFREGRIVHETDWFADAFPAPVWRSDWVEIVG